MLQDPIVQPQDGHMESVRPGSDRRNKPNNGSPEQVLKCPRCDSLNTKFCYFNNYSLTQPRHFCKNCRRYWTQGGSLRNVPVGGGCRKNKRIKQRTVDPHVFGGLEDQCGAPGSFLHVGGATGSLLSSNCFAPPGTNPVPGFGDLLPSNDSHLLSMAFSRLQESLRLGEHAEGALPASSNPIQLSMMHSPPLYDSSLIPYSNGHVKPEHLYSGSELGTLLDPANHHHHHHLGSGTVPLVSIEDQLSSFEVPSDHGFSGCSIEAQLTLQQQKQLALHLGAASDHHHIAGVGGSASNGNGGSASCLENKRAHHPQAQLQFLQRQHGALPNFEEHESPESTGRGMQMLRQAGGGGASGLHPGGVTGIMAMSKGKELQGVDGSWAGDHHHHHHQDMVSHGMAQLQAAAGAGEMHLQQGHEDAYHEPVRSTAADQQMISFWSPSPWSDHVQAAGTPARAHLEPISHTYQ